MSLSDRHFDKSNNSSNKNDRPTHQWFNTNSAEFGFGQIEVKVTGKVEVDRSAVITALQELAKTIEVTFEYHYEYTSLLPEGALTMPAVFIFDDKRYSLYFIYQEEDVLKYHDLIKHIKHTSYPNLIYLSAIPFTKGDKQKPIIQPFKLANLRYEPDAIIAGEYAMWWQTPDECTLNNSATFEYLSRMYDVYKGYETYLHGYILQQTEVLVGELSRIKLPEDHVKYVLQAPENKKIFLDISQEKGIRFLFPVITTSRAYRERFLHGIVADLLAARLALQNQEMPLDEQLKPNSYDWFQYISQAVTQKESTGEQIELIGGIRANVSMN
jgi:hypothetical protein